MKIVLMNGGLGNQLFQYAFYRYIEKHTNDICYIDDSAFYGKNVEHNGFEIERIFGVTCNCLLSRYFDNEIWLAMIRKKEEGISIPQQILNAGLDISLIAETNDYSFDGEVLHFFNKNDLHNNNNNVYYHGYWINDCFFNELKDEFLGELKFPSIKDADNINKLNYISSKNSVALHVRRGDFVNLGRALDTNYYIEAIKKIENRISDGFYFVFSDDINWCIEHQKELGLDQIKDKYVFFQGNTGEKSYIDMQLMASCKHMILANSSFSSFAALLNTNKDKTVIVPCI